MDRKATKTVKATKMKEKMKGATMMPERMMKKSMKTKPRQKRAPMMSPRTQRLAERRQIHKRLHRNPWLESWNPHEAKENPLTCIHGIQNLWLLNLTQHRLNQSAPLPMPCLIASPKDTKMDTPPSHLGQKIDPTPTTLITHTHAKRSCLVRHPSGILALDLHPFWKAHIEQRGPAPEHIRFPLAHPHIAPADSVPVGT